MILRRVAAHMRRQEWTAVALDFLIVVAGVFVGIQVANWNEREADKQRAQAYIERLAKDLDTDLAARRELVAYYAAVLASVERTNALLADAASDPQQLVIHAYRASELNFAPQSRSTWDEIVSAGDIGLLPSAVTAGVTSYYAGDTMGLVFDSIAKSLYRHQVRTIIPLELQQALRRGCSDVRDDAQQIIGFMSECSLDIEASLIRDTAAALRSDDRLHAELRYQYSEIFSARANIESDVIILQRALATLKGAPPATPAGAR